MSYLLPHLRTGWAVDQAILNDTHVRVQAWADPALMAYSLHALITDHTDDIDNVDRLAAYIVGMKVPLLLDMRLPLNPADWWKHPDIASGSVRFG